MALFEFTELGKSKKDFLTSSITSGNENIITSGQQSLKEIIGPLFMGRTVHYVTKGRWSLHDLLIHLISHTGPAKVWFTSWSMTRQPFMDIVDLMKQGKIIELTCVMDRRMKTVAPEALALAKYHSVRLSLDDIHAKTLVLTNGHWSICVISSQNMTRNRRIEAGVITCDHEAAAFHANWIEKLIKDGEKQ